METNKIFKEQRLISTDFRFEAKKNDKMKSITKNDFSEISCSISGNLIYQYWYKASENLSEWEFLEQIDTLFSTAEVFNSRFLYIDAFDFCYMINDKSMQQIKVQIESCNIKVIGIVLSSNLLGKLYILRLLKRMSITGINLTIFKTRKEGDLWVNLKKTQSVIRKIPINT